MLIWKTPLNFIKANSLFSLLPVFLFWISFQLLCFGAAAGPLTWPARITQNMHWRSWNETNPGSSPIKKRRVLGFGSTFFFLRSTLVSRLIFEPWHLMDKQRLTVSIKLFCLKMIIRWNCRWMFVGWYQKAIFKLCWSLAKIIYAWTTGRQKLPCGKWYLISLETGAPKGKDRQAVCRRWKQGELKL